MALAFDLFPLISHLTSVSPGAAQNAAIKLANSGNISNRPQSSPYDQLFSKPIIGTDGSDTLLGTRYADSLYGQGGNDLLQGGLGNDTYHFGIGGGEDQIYDAGGWDAIVLEPGLQLTDVVIGRVVDLKESDGDGVFVAINSGLGEPDFIFSHGAGEIEAVRFADGTQISGALLDTLMATNLTYFGTDGADTVLGGNGVDYLHGRAGDDVLCGNRGDDAMIGGPGNDTYVFSAGDGFDQIVDIQGDHDVLVLNGIDPDTVHSFYTADGGLMLDFGARGGILIQGDIEEIQFIGTAIDEVWTADDISNLGG